MSLLQKLRTEIGKYVAVTSLAIASYACESEPASSGENPCTMQGEVLFEEEFERESDMDKKWEGVLMYLYNNGVLEMGASRIGTSKSLLNTRSTYTSDDRTLIFEARWKVGGREGIQAGVSLYNQDDLGSIGFVERDNELSCFVNSGDGSDTLPCNLQMTEFQTTRIKVNSTQSYFCNGDSLIGSLGSVRTDIGYNISISCSSNDGEEKRCFFDYVKLLAK